MSQMEGMKKNEWQENYWIFVVIILISIVIMYAAMFLDVAEIKDIYFSMTMLYMVLLMACPMAITMLFCMKNMYANKKLNMIITTVLVIIFICALFCLRNQTFVNDKD